MTIIRTVFSAKKIVFKLIPIYDIRITLGTCDTLVKRKDCTPLKKYN